MEHVKTQLDAAKEREEMTDKKQPEALRLADEAWNFDCSEYRGVRSANAAMMGKLQDCADMIRKLHTENTALQQGYAAARLEIESLQARIKAMAEEHADELMVAHLDVRMLGRSTEPTVEYPLLPEHVGKVEVSTTLENSGLRRHKASPAYTPDQRRAYVDRAVRAEQPATAQQPDTAYAELPDADRDYMRKVVAVAVTMLFDGYKEDVMRVFSTGELSEFVTITAAMRVEKVEDIYRRAWDLLSLPASASHGQAPAQAIPAAAAGCTRSHPHENMDSACRAKAAIAEMQNMAARGAEATTHDLERFVAMLAAAPTTQAVPVRGAPADLPPLPDPDLRDVGTKPEDIKNFLRGYATEYAKAALAARAPADSVLEDAARLKALHAAVTAIYLDDSSDFKSALGAVVRHLDPALAGDLLAWPKRAYDISLARLDAARKQGGA